MKKCLKCNRIWSSWKEATTQCIECHSTDITEDW